MYRPGVLFREKKNTFRVCSGRAIPTLGISYSSLVVILGSVSVGLRQVYLEIEGDLEEDLGEVTGNLQGGFIDVITTEEMKSWRAAVEQAGVHRKKK